MGRERTTRTKWTTSTKTTRRKEEEKLLRVAIAGTSAFVLRLRSNRAGYRFVKLLTNHNTIRWSFDAQAYSATGNAHNRHDDLIANDKTLTDFATEHEHGNPPECILVMAGNRRNSSKRFLSRQRLHNPNTASNTGGIPRFIMSRNNSNWMLAMQSKVGKIKWLSPPTNPLSLGVDSMNPKQAKLDDNGSILWYDVQALNVEGKGWSDTKSPFDRLPAKAERKVRDAVWNLSRHSAGMCVRFVSDSSNIHARWSVTSANLAMPHMPATGVSGVDLYMRSPSDRKWRWVAVGQPKQSPTNSVQLASGLPAGDKEFMLYFPLYNGVTSVEIGLSKDSRLNKAPAYPPGHDRPIVFYGTSITQGGCASRPGMVHTAILQRRLDCSVINLGFSGNGKMEPEVTDLLAEIDAAVYVIDCLPNMDGKAVSERTEPLVRQLRAARPLTPILLVEDREFADAWVAASRKQRNEENRKELWAAYQRLLASGVGGLHYLPGSRLLGEDREDTVDGSHPTDLGFMRQADAFEPALRTLLPTPGADSERQPLEGYTDQVSYQPGDEIHFHLSTATPTLSLEIARIGSQRAVVWKQESVAGKRHSVPANCSSHGCGWPETLTVKVPAEWQSGYYVAQMKSKLPDGKETAADVWFIIRSARPGQDTKILIQL
jgi:lysophospholipase L1-like esterase